MTPESWTHEEWDWGKQNNIHTISNAVLSATNLKTYSSPTE